MPRGIYQRSKEKTACKNGCGRIFAGVASEVAHRKWCQKNNMASKAKAMDEPRRPHRAKGTWTLTLTNGTKQFAATINSSAIKRILGVVIGDN